MSLSVQSPTALPIMHMTEPEADVSSRGTLPKGKTLDKVIAVLGAINITLTAAASTFLTRQNGSVNHLDEMSAEKKKELITKAFVITFLGTLGALATGASGFGAYIAPALQGFNANITADMVKSTSKGTIFIRIAAITTRMAAAIFLHTWPFSPRKI